MNSGYVVHLDAFGEQVDDAERAGQQTTDGSWDWLAKPSQEMSASVATGTNNERVVDFLYGEATWTRNTSEDRITVSDEGRIHTREETTTTRHAAEFLLAPSEGIGVVSDLGCLFHIEKMFTALDVSEAELDLRGLVDALDVDQWGVGFAGRGVAEGGRKGALYGDRVEDDPDLGEQLQHTPLSDVGFEHRYGSEKLKAYLAESGYVAAYGEGWTATDFVPWVIEVVAPHVRDLDAVDEDQATLEEASESTDLEDDVAANLGGGD